MPVYFSGLLLIIVFSIWLRWLPSGGMHTLGKEFSLVDGLRHLLAAPEPLDLDRGQVRALPAHELLEVIHLDYIRTAAAKGLHERVIVYSTPSATPRSRS